MDGHELGTWHTTYRIILDCWALAESACVWSQVVPIDETHCEVVFDYYLDKSLVSNSAFIEESLSASEKVQDEVCSHISYLAAFQFVSITCMTTVHHTVPLCCMACAGCVPVREGPAGSRVIGLPVGTIRALGRVPDVSLPSAVAQGSAIGVVMTLAVDG